MKADNRGSGGEGSGAEDEKKGDLLTPRALDLAEGLVREDEDPDVGDDVESRGGVEEGSCVDATSSDGARKIPHFVQGTTLGEGHDKADEEEDGMENDGANAEHPEGSGDGEAEVGEENRRLDAKYIGVVQDLYRQGCLDEGDHVVWRQSGYGEAYAILAQDEEHDHVTDGDGLGDSVLPLFTKSTKEKLTMALSMK